MSGSVEGECRVSVGLTTPSTILKSFAARHFLQFEWRVEGETEKIL